MTGMMWDAFAYREEGRRGTYHSVVGPRLYVALHGLNAPIVPVIVTEVDDGDPAGTHWGWIGTGEDAPAWALVWPSRPQFEVCFPYGVRAEEKAGKGRSVRLRVDAPGTEVPASQRNPMTSITKHDRVGYTVMYGGTPGHPQHRTEFGRVTRIRTGGSRRQPRATIAVENPEPGSARYVERYVADLTPAPAAGPPGDTGVSGPLGDPAAAR